VTTRISVEADVTSANSQIADTLRAELERRGILTLNIIASPGAGKTTLVERTISGMADELSFAVIEGDLATSLDADRIKRTGAPAVQINTGAGCHLEARMVRTAMETLSLDDLDVLIIENVGNLVCPTGWDLGEDCKVVVASLPEGDDKPLKYPTAFSTAQAVVINKVDLEPYIPATAETMRANALRINDELATFVISAQTGQGLEAWFGWIRDQLRIKREGASKPNA
jgi:hydrogenase nickel incorporation protein HypB